MREGAAGQDGDGAGQYTEEREGDVQREDTTAMHAWNASTEDVTSPHVNKQSVREGPRVAAATVALLSLMNHLTPRLSSRSRARMTDESGRTTGNRTVQNDSFLPHPRPTSFPLQPSNDQQILRNVNRHPQTLT